MTRYRYDNMLPSSLEHDTERKADLLKNVTLFAGLDAVEIQALAEVAMVRHVPSDAIILLAEEEGDTLFVIVGGRLDQHFPKSCFDRNWIAQSPFIVECL